MSTTEDMMSTEADSAVENEQTVEQRLDSLEDEVSELRAENEVLRERAETLETIVDIKTDCESAGLSDIWIAGEPVGMMLQSQKKYREAQNAYIFGTEFGVGIDIDTIKNEAQEEPLLERFSSGGVDSSTSTGLNRDRMRPAHRMWHDYDTGDENALGKTQRRAGVLFGEFVNRAINKESNNVDASGQNFSMNSQDARETLEEHGEVDEVSEASKGTVVPRLMREMAAFTKDHMEDDCECDSIDQCSHTLIDFRAGKPHTLAVPKARFKAVLQYALDNTDDSSVQDDEDVSSRMEQLDAATKEDGK